MAIQKTEAIVLKKLKFRESSLIVTFYTRGFGKIKGILKGIMRSKNKFASPLELFSHNQIIFYESLKSELYIISQCDLKNNFSAIREDLTKIGLASYMIELLDSVMPLNDENDDVFELLSLSLNQLSAKFDHDLDAIRRAFEIKFLSLSGFKPHLTSCIHCGKKAFMEAAFSLRLGGLLCQDCVREDTLAKAISQAAMASILHIERMDLVCSLRLKTNQRVKEELEDILRKFLRFHFEKDWSSLQFLDRIKRTNRNDEKLKHGGDRLALQKAGLYLPK